MSFFVFFGMTLIQMAITSGFMVFILKDPEYYDLSTQDANAELGYIGSICEFSIIFIQIFIGPVADAFGKKWVSVISLAVSSIALASIPLFNTVYPGFLMMRILVACGTSVGNLVPILADYLTPDSLGVGFSMAALIGGLITGAGMGAGFALVGKTDIGIMLYGIGGVAFVVCVICALTMKDVRVESTGIRHLRPRG